MVGEIDGETGEVVTMETLCEANNINAASVSGPTDAQLEFGWQCENIHQAPCARVTMHHITRP